MTMCPFDEPPSRVANRALERTEDLMARVLALEKQMAALMHAHPRAEADLATETKRQKAESQAWKKSARAAGLEVL